MVEWRPDSSKIVVAVSEFSFKLWWNYLIHILLFQTEKYSLIFYDVFVDGIQKEAYEQDDSPMPSLRRYSAELYTKEKIPPLTIKKVKVCELILYISYYKVSDCLSKEKYYYLRSQKLISILGIDSICEWSQNVLQDFGHAVFYFLA